ARVHGRAAAMALRGISAKRPLDLIRTEGRVAVRVRNQTRVSMSDIDSLYQEISAAIEAAGTEAALEEVRIAALGKKGKVSELMKTLDAMTPGERQAMRRELIVLERRTPSTTADCKETRKL